MSLLWVYFLKMCVMLGFTLDPLRVNLGLTRGLLLAFSLNVFYLIVLLSVITTTCLFQRYTKRLSHGSTSDQGLCAGFTMGLLGV